MEVRVGILGAGFMATQHAKALQAMEGVRVVAVAHHQRAQAEAFIERNHLQADPYGSGLDLVERAEVDAIYFCLPPHAHQGEVERAAEMGRHVFLEKPIARGSARARSMVEAIERAGVISMVGHMMRFSPAAQRLKRMIVDGTAGRPALFTGRFWTNMEGSPWWRDVARSGGQLFEQTIHLYDLACFFLGEVESSSGVALNLLHRHEPDYTIDDTSLGTLRFRNGAIASISGSNCAVPMHFFGDYRVVCENVTLDYRCSGQPWVQPDEAVFYLKGAPPESQVQDRSLFGEENAHFVECLRRGQPTLCPAREGLRLIEILEPWIPR